MKARSILAFGSSVGIALAVLCVRTHAGGIEPVSDEFPLTLRTPGDQVNPAIALGSRGGLIAWQDAAIDGQGLGIAALRLNETLSSHQGGSFRVNEQVEGDQENVRVLLLPDGSAFFAWQGGPLGFQRIHARVLSADGTFATGDIPVSSGAGEHELDPAIALLSDGTVVVTWASYRRDGLNYDIYARRFTAAGEPLGDDFRVNQQLGLGRRSPTVAARRDGGFVVAWVGERIIGERDSKDTSGRRVTGAGAPVFEVAVYTAAFDASGESLREDLRVAALNGVAAHPALAALSDGRFLLAWTRRDLSNRANGFDIASVVLDADGKAAGSEQLLNSYLEGDQYRPVLAATGAGVLAVWTSMGQDGSFEGVYGRWLGTDGQPAGDQVQINTTTRGGQIQPGAAASSASRILVAWSSMLPQSGLEIFGRRLAAEQELAPLPAPSVVALSSSSVMVTWPGLAGVEGVAYRVYGGDGAQLAEIPETFLTVENLAPASTFSAQVAYVLATGEVSPRSAAGSGKTWGADRNFDGLPDDWQEQWWPGPKYPAGNEDSDGDGVSNLDEWLAGTDPTDPESNLRVRGEVTPHGLRVEWLTQPGFVYQLQVSSDGVNWSNISGPRFAADRTDSVITPASDRVALYRVIRVR